MRWRNVVRGLVGLLEGDAAVSAELGGPHIYRRMDVREVQVPSITWLMLNDSEQETTEEALIQWEVFAASEAQEEALEGRLRALVISEDGMVVGGIALLTPREDFSVRQMPSARAGSRHLQMDVRYAPARM